MMPQDPADESEFNPPDPSTAIEVEQKFHLDDPRRFESALRSVGAAEAPIEQHADTYYRHPARDFAQTREALRIRRLVTHRGQSIALVTYKGPYLPGEVKSRPELEWRIDVGDEGGRNFAQLLGHLGFIEALTVAKSRRPFTLDRGGRCVVVSIDDAGSLGYFSEIETIAENATVVPDCQQIVASLAADLGLDRPERRSYLTMALATLGQNRGT